MASSPIEISTWNSVWESSKVIFAFTDNFLTTILGVIAVWGLLRHRKEIALGIRILVAGHLNERLKQVRETLTKLEGLNNENKDDRREIAALFGQICGQIRLLAIENTDLSRIHTEIFDVIERRKQVTEAQKRRLTSEVHGALDNLTMLEIHRILTRK